MKKFIQACGLILLVVVLLLSATIDTPTANSSATALTPTSAPLLHVSGNKVITAKGSVYVPEGISVYGGLEDPDYASNLANIRAQIVAAIKYWHANTVRLQVAESNLLTNDSAGKDYNQTFLNDLEQQVALIHSMHAAAVINDQTEFTTDLPSPTGQTVKFWHIMSQTFGNKQYVIFDLFNEPRLTNGATTQNQLLPDIAYSLFGVSRLAPAYHSSGRHFSNSKVWSLWKNGGKVNGISYVGMQTLVNQIRKTGVNNIIWVEGPNEARELPAGKYVLKGTNLVYSIHHPNLNSPNSWRRISKLAASHPVVDGEWSQYESSWAECYSQAYTNAPLYLNFLQAHNIGVIAWSLQKNSLLEGDARVKPSNMNSTNDPRRAVELRTPNRLLSNYSCSNRFGQGVGQLLKNYFAKHSASSGIYGN